MFLKNCWYVAAQPDEVGRALTQRWIAGEPVLLYRTTDGAAVAMEDRCPHRRASLSKGVLVGDAVQCGYHGMQFGPDGRCQHIHGQADIPTSMRTRTYPLVEKWRWLWVWLGDPAQADESLIPDLQYNDTPGWTVVGGVLIVQAHYQLLVDNLLDLTHETFVHARTIGNSAVAETPMEAKVVGNEVHVKRIMPGTPAPPLFRKVRGLSTIDRWQIIRFQAPCSVTIDARGYPEGSDDISKGLRWFSVNSITPVDERTCRYFWTITRCFDQDDAALSQLIHDQILATFLEDVEVIEAQQKLIETDRRGVSEVSVRADFGAVAARKVVLRLIAQETRAATAELKATGTETIHD